MSDKGEAVNMAARNLKFEQLRSDHETFLRTFEKPTQIYRFLRTRNIITPIFLHRNLLYMRHRRTKNTTKEQSGKFKVDDLLEKCEQGNTGDSQLSSEKNGYLNLTFKGFFRGPVHGELPTPSSENLADQNLVPAEVFIVKVCHKRRKESSPQIIQERVGRCLVPHNPCTDQEPILETCSVSIPRSIFNPKTNRNIRSFILTLEVSVPLIETGKKKKRKKSEQKTETKQKSESSEPPSKRLRGQRASLNSENEQPEKPEDLDTSLQTCGAVSDKIIYFTELIIFGNERECLLVDGEYELVLHDKGNGKQRKRKQLSWEIDYNGKLGPFELYAFGPTLKFLLAWEGKPLYTRPSSLPLRERQLDSNANMELTTVASTDENDKESRKRLRIFYQFIYNNHTRQQTEARDDCLCPWCGVNCVRLYSLLKHLKCCHGRFLFTYAPHNKGARIDVCLNESYDGSYAGGVEDLNEMVGYAFSRDGPVRRTPYTAVLVWRPKRGKESLNEFLEPDESDADVARPFFNGHNRVYFHSNTCLPMKPDDLEFDSEDEIDPEWLRIKTQQMIDEFTDVNDGEKKLMKMWNIHVMKRGYIADLQIPEACKTFVREYGDKIVQEKLCRNFILHLVNLNDFNILGKAQLLQSIELLDEIRYSLD
ncbi:polycomb protein Suz12-like [Dendronephthya gigantea]|uniref:polycomb protein Suz12-like n=1 Tax=Dendronephthya gigantea TaxID=151771 RepID=UPI001069319B|nr:polycomb protein Suz12-like [Dendronephthya gigantea]